MVNKIIKLGFSDAGVFFNNITDFKQKDRIIKNGVVIGKRNYQNDSFKEVLIHVNHVSNLLHVMCNKRPVPSFRKVIWGRDEEIHNLAKQSYVKINGLKTNSFHDDNIFLFSETIQKAYSSWNSWKTNVVIGWHKLYQIMGDEWFECFVSYVNNDLKLNVHETKLEDLLVTLANDWGDMKYSRDINPKFNKSFDELIGCKINGYSFTYLTKTPKEKITVNSLLKNTTIKGVSTESYSFSENYTQGVDKYYKDKSNYFKLSGEIVVPINDETLENILNNKVICKFLDGGFAHILDIKNINDFNSEDYIKL